MADNNKLELVVEVDVNKANASIKSINTGLSSMEQAAGKAARGASAGIDGLTVSMVRVRRRQPPRGLDQKGTGLGQGMDARRCTARRPHRQDESVDGTLSRKPMA